MNRRVSLNNTHIGENERNSTTERAIPTLHTLSPLRESYSSLVEKPKQLRRESEQNSSTCVRKRAQKRRFDNHVDFRRDFTRTSPIRRIARPKVDRLVSSSHSPSRTKKERTKTPQSGERSSNVMKSSSLSCMSSTVHIGRTFSDKQTKPPQKVRLWEQLTAGL